MIVNVEPVDGEMEPGDVEPSPQSMDASKSHAAGFGHLTRNPARSALTTKLGATEIVRDVI